MDHPFRPAPAGHSPLRRPHSVRRTSSIDVTWPAGYDENTHFDGLCRDIYTPAAGGQPLVLREDRFVAAMTPHGAIASICATPARAGLDALIGKGRGDKLRNLIDELLPAERISGSPLYLLLDDLPASSLISGWAWSRWIKGWVPRRFANMDIEEARALRREMMAEVCTGFRPGSSALDDVHGEKQDCRPVVSLVHPDDPSGFHELTRHTQVSMRRARRIDVWRNDRIHIDATFQDSASTPDGGRVAVHEYLLNAVVDPVAMTLLGVEADPRILPYPECPAAAGNVNRLVGVPLRDLRGVVLRELRRTLGCTHLNDALRALAEVPMLVAALADQQRLAGEGG